MCHRKCVHFVEFCLDFRIGISYFRLKFQRTKMAINLPPLIVNDSLCILLTLDVSLFCCNLLFICSSLIRNCMDFVFVSVEIWWKSSAHNVIRMNEILMMSQWYITFPPINNWLKEKNQAHFVGNVRETKNINLFPYHWSFGNSLAISIIQCYDNDFDDLFRHLKTSYIHFLERKITQKKKQMKKITDLDDLVFIVLCLWTWIFPLITSKDQPQIWCYSFFCECINNFLVIQFTQRIKSKFLFLSLKFAIVFDVFNL